MERTLAALPRLLGAGKGGQQRQSPPSRGLVALKNAVDNARGRSEQDAVVRQSTYQGFVLAWSLSAVAAWFSSFDFHHCPLGWEGCESLVVFTMRRRGKQ